MIVRKHRGPGPRARRRRATAALLVVVTTALLVTIPAPAHADTITDNMETTQALWTFSRSGPSSVQTPYCGVECNNGGISAGAAHSGNVKGWLQINAPAGSWTSFRRTFPGQLDDNCRLEIWFRQMGYPFTPVPAQVTVSVREVSGIFSWPVDQATLAVTGTSWQRYSVVEWPNHGRQHRVTIRLDFTGGLTGILFDDVTIFCYTIT
jgi:hypothetical protein